MARRVFFSYHFGRDNWRANQVRNCWVTKLDRQSAGFFDSAEQEEVKRTSDEAVRRWIDEQLQYTSVTAVLIGAETSERELVRYEIRKSFERGNALLGIRIHNLKDKDGATDYPGDNPLDDFLIETESRTYRLSEIFPTYDWKRNGEKDNIGDWVEEAFEINRLIHRLDQVTIYQQGEDNENSGILTIGLKIALVGGLAGLIAGLADEYLRRKRHRDKF